jgi:uncharacterized protein (DUF697 family)
MIKRPVHGTAITLGVVGALLSPIPLVDELIIMPTYIGLIYPVGRAHGLKVWQMPWRASARTALNGVAARAAVNLAFLSLPGFAAVANSLSAFALTELYGKFLNDACANPKEAKAIGPTAIAKALRARLPFGKKKGEPAPA